MTFGFGPLGANATTTRPAAGSDTYGQQTWFKDATGAGTNDGTVMDASWLNHIVANAVQLCVLGGVDISNRQDVDHWWYDAVLKIAATQAVLATSALKFSSLSDYDANKVVDHSNVSITAGEGLTGGGDLTQTRTLALNLAGLTFEASPAANDEFMVLDTSAGALRRMTISSFAAFFVPTGNFTATVNPTADDDANDGYSVGSRWVNTTSGETWTCTDATVGAAVWAHTSVDASELGSMAYQNSSNVTITGGTISGVSLSFALGDGSDVVLTSPTDNQVLQYSGGNWIDGVSLNQNLQTVDSPTFASLTLTANIAAQGGSISAGVDDTTPGLINVYGGANAGAEGGEIRLFNDADNDASYEYYFFDAASGILRIGRAGNVDLSLNGSGIFAFANAAHTIGGNAIYHAGNLAAVSQAEAEAGTATTARTWTAERVKQAIDALAGGGGFASGTVMLFKQASAPTGWTKDTTASLNDNALRIVTGTPGSGGSVNFSSLFGTTAVDAHTLTESQIPAHTHNVTAVEIAGTTYDINAAKSGNEARQAAITSTSTGGGSSHDHGLDMRVKYQDVIVATKD